MTISELTVSDVAAYLKIEDADLTESETGIITAMLNAARMYVQNYTGRDTEYLDQHPEVAIAALCLAGDFYTNRDMFTNIKGTGTASVNKTVQSILDMHRFNLLPSEEVEDV